MLAIEIALGVAVFLICSVFCLMLRIDAVAARLDRRIDEARRPSRH
jgi:hypothetical protein